MHVVAIAELSGTVEAEAAALAQANRTTAYEEQLKLRAGMPAIVLSTPDPARAGALRDGLRARGHRAIALDTASVVPSSEMVELRAFRLAADALEAGDPAESRLPWAQIGVMLRARHSRRVETGEVKQKQFALGRAIVSGGLIVSKNVTTREAESRSEAEDVLYLFRHDGGTPFLLRETTARYAALGAHMAPTIAQNFRLAVARLRERAPSAKFDERLLQVRKLSERHVHTSADQKLTVSSEGHVDLLAHLTAMTLLARDG